MELAVGPALDSLDIGETQRKGMAESSRKRGSHDAAVWAGLSVVSIL